MTISSILTGKIDPQIKRSGIKDRKSENMKPYFLSKEDLNKFVAALKKCLPDFMFSENEIVSQWFVAGGFIRDYMIDDQPKDVDIFFRSEEAAKNIVRIWEKTLLEAQPQFRWKQVTSSNCAVTFEKEQKVLFQGKKTTFEQPKVQLIINPLRCGEPVSIVSGFDFFCCMAVYDPIIRCCYVHENIHVDLKLRMINYNIETVSNPIHSLKRAMNFRQRKWHIGIEFCILPILDAIIGYRERMKDLSEDKWVPCYTDTDKNPPKDKRTIKLFELLNPFEILMMRKMGLDDILQQVLA